MSELVRRTKNFLLAAGGGVAGNCATALLNIAAAVLGDPTLAVVGQVAGPVVSAGVTEVGDYLYSAMAADRQSRVERFATTAQRDSGVGVDELAQAAADNPAYRQLLARLVQASSRSWEPEKIDRYARMLVHGWKDPAKVCDLIRLIERLEALDDGEIRAFGAVNRALAQHGEVNLSVIGGEDPGIKPALVLLLDKLVKVELLTSNGAAWNLTAVGRYIADRLTEIESALPAPD